QGRQHRAARQLWPRSVSFSGQEAVGPNDLRNRQRCRCAAAGCANHSVLDLRHVEPPGRHIVVDRPEARRIRPILSAKYHYAGATGSATTRGFPIVEIDSSYYGIPAEANARLWT